MEKRCWCICHQHVRADYNAAWLVEDWDTARRLAGSVYINTPQPFFTDDPLEAAVASGCSCLNRHLPALGFLPPKEWSPDADATGDTD